VTGTSRGGFAFTFGAGGAALAPLGAAPFADIASLAALSAAAFAAPTDSGRFAAASFFGTGFFAAGFAFAGTGFFAAGFAFAGTGFFAACFAFAGAGLRTGFAAGRDFFCALPGAGFDFFGALLAGAFLRALAIVLTSVNLRSGVCAPAVSLASMRFR
jgi:hypothetical protein